MDCTNHVWKIDEGNRTCNEKNGIVNKYIILDIRLAALYHSGWLVNDSSL